MIEQNSIVKHRVSANHRDIWGSNGTRPFSITAKMWVSVIPGFPLGRNKPKPWEMKFWKTNAWFELTPLRVTAVVPNFFGGINSSANSLRKRNMERYAGLINAVCAI